MKHLDKESDLSKWDKRFIRLAVETSQYSKDVNCKVGAVIISEDKREISYGYNGFPSKVADSEWLLNSKIKNKITIHAELNAILNSKKSLVGHTIYTTKYPCINCCLAIIQSGIKRLVVYDELDESSKWIEEQLFAYELLDACYIESVLVNKNIFKI